MSPFLEVFTIRPRRDVQGLPLHLPSCFVLLPKQGINDALDVGELLLQRMHSFKPLGRQSHLLPELIHLHLRSVPDIFRLLHGFVSVDEVWFRHVDWGLVLRFNNGSL